MPKKQKQSWKSLAAAAKELKQQRNASSRLLRHHLDRLPHGYVKNTIYLPLDTTSILLGKSSEDLEQNLPTPDRNGKVRFKISTIEGIKYVCALSGHSIPGAKEALEQLNLVVNLTWDDVKDRQLIHATTPDGFDGITTSGFLEPRGRAIHFASSNTEYKTYPVPLKTRVAGGGHFSLKVGILKKKLPHVVFYLAENGVVLCDSKLPIDYLEWHLN